MSDELSQCTYMKRSGERCIRRCYNKRCNLHKHKTSHSLCVNECGRATLSITGYCTSCDQAAALQSMRRARRNEEQMEIERKKEEAKEQAEWDAYLDDLLRPDDLVLDLHE